MNEKDKQLVRKFRTMQTAYTQLVEGSHTLLGLNTVYWTEALLLKLVRYLYRLRLQQISGIVEQIPDELD